MSLYFKFLFTIALFSCAPSNSKQLNNASNYKIIPGAENPKAYLGLLKNKRVAGVFNQSSRIGDQHIIDFLINEKVNFTKVFTLEHGFRGDADAGANIDNNVDVKTGVPIISLYGKNKKPQKVDLENVDVIVFDVQDVGVRFYTYISTLHYVMEACAENDIQLIILDRPNPNAHYVDGPILKKKYNSFIGMHEVPVVYGMTIGEYGQMIKGEQWINKAEKCSLKVIPCQNYTHDSIYELPIKPSPNLPNLRSILLYPSLCFFEGTALSIGRGTDKQFQCIGHPSLNTKPFSFTPVSMPGATEPKLENQLCYGEDLSNLNPIDVFNIRKLNLGYLVEYHKLLNNSDVEFFTRPDFFDLLAGTDQLRVQIASGMQESDIRKTWLPELEEFKKIRAKYLLYD